MNMGWWLRGLLMAFMVLLLVAECQAYNVVPLRHSRIVAEMHDLYYQMMIRQFPDSEENRVISFTLYGNDKKYTLGAIRNAELAPKYYPGWKLRFYVHSDVSDRIVDQLKELNCEVLPYPEEHGAKFGMLWRFVVAADAGVDRFLVRDVDSRLSYRERFAVEEWIQSQKQVHIMRDHPYHSAPVMGGMWGGVGGALPGLMTQIEAWEDKACNVYACDMTFLKEVYWDAVFAPHSLAHDAFNCERFPDTLTRPFPTPRNDLYEHVGQVFDYKEVAYQEDIVSRSQERSCAHS